FLRGLPYAERLEFLRLADSGTIQSAFRAGEIHEQSTGVDKTFVDAITKDRPQTQVVKFNTSLGAGLHLGLNTTRPPLDNLTVRPRTSPRPAPDSKAPSSPAVRATSPRSQTPRSMP